MWSVAGALLIFEPCVSIRNCRPHYDYNKTMVTQDEIRPWISLSHKPQGKVGVSQGNLRQYIIGFYYTRKYIMYIISEIRDDLYYANERMISPFLRPMIRRLCT